MPNIQRVDLVWQFPNGGPGLTTLYGINAGPVAAAAHTFFEAIKTRIPLGVTISWSGTGDNYDVATGELTEVYTGGTAWTTTGTGTGVWAAGVGASVRWLTGGVWGGHRVFGRTYLIPLNSFSYGSDGTLDANALSEFQAAAQTLITNAGADFQVYSRPKPARPGKHGTLPAIDGAIFTVVGRTVDDKVSTLRSRRT